MCNCDSFFLLQWRTFKKNSHPHPHSADGLSSFLNYVVHIFQVIYMYVLTHILEWNMLWKVQKIKEVKQPQQQVKIQLNIFFPGYVNVMFLVPLERHRNRQEYFQQSPMSDENFSFVNLGSWNRVTLSWFLLFLTILMSQSAKLI